jgi:hypothetical protein
MTDVEMRFALVRDAIGRGYSVEDAIFEAGQLVAFASTGALPQSRGPIISWHSAGEVLTLYYEDGSRTSIAGTYNPNRDVVEVSA